jgi:hypothetical protein
VTATATAALTPSEKRHGDAPIIAPSMNVHGPANEERPRRAVDPQLSNDSAHGNAFSRTKRRMPPGRATEDAGAFEMASGSSASNATPTACHRVADERRDQQLWVLQHQQESRCRQATKTASYRESMAPTRTARFYPALARLRAFGASARDRSSGSLDFEHFREAIGRLHACAEWHKP